MIKFLHIYKLEQNINNGYDTYDSCIVVAATADKARLITPDGRTWLEHDKPCYRNWVCSDQVESIIVTYLGVAAPRIPAGTVLLASFNAG